MRDTPLGLAMDYPDTIQKTQETQVSFTALVHSFKRPPKTILFSLFCPLTTHYSSHQAEWTCSTKPSSADRTCSWENAFVHSGHTQRNIHFFLFWIKSSWNLRKAKFGRFTNIVWVITEHSDNIPIFKAQKLEEQISWLKVSQRKQKCWKKYPEWQLNL